MQPFKKTGREPEVLDDDCSEPQSNVRAKAKPVLDQHLEQIAADWEAGLLTPDQAIEKMIDANTAWAARFISSEQRKQLELFLRTMFDTDPRLLRLAGREG